MIHPRKGHWISILCLTLILSFSTTVFAENEYTEEDSHMSIEESVNIVLTSIASKKKEKISDAPGVISPLTLCAAMIFCAIFCPIFAFLVESSPPAPAGIYQYKIIRGCILAGQTVSGEGAGELSNCWFRFRQEGIPDGAEKLSHF